MRLHPRVMGQVSEVRVVYSAPVVGTAVVVVAVLAAVAAAAVVASAAAAAAAAADAADAAAVVVEEVSAAGESIYCGLMRVWCPIDTQGSMLSVFPLSHSKWRQRWRSRRERWQVRKKSV